MRDEWYADKRDLAKWGILVHLASGHNAVRVLQVAYYTPSVWGEIEVDGSTYPLSQAVLDHFRSVGHVTGLAAGCKVEVLIAPFEDRPRYAELVRNEIAKCRSRQVVFLDPDTGLAPSKPSMKHVLERELADVWQALSPGDVLVFYQHQTNRDGKPWVEPKRLQFERALGLCPGSARLARAPKIARDAAFFFAVKPDPAWFRLAKSYPVARGITFPFLLGALRQPPGLVCTAEESRTELRELLASMRDDTPVGYQVAVSLCGGIGQLIVGIEFSGIAAAGDADIPSPGDPSRGIRVEPIYGLRVRDLEDLVDEVWQRHGQVICEGRFSYSSRERTWRPFAGEELASIARCLDAGREGAP